MRCEEAAEFVSALCDGERIPQSAAEHIGACAACRLRLTDYLEMGAELRRSASLEAEPFTAPMAWKQGQGSLAMWWQKGWEVMRIPRIVFAVLVAGVVLLGSGLAVVGARTASEGTVMMLTVSAGAGNSYDCALSTTIDKRLSVCSAIGKVNATSTTSGTLGDEVSFLGMEGDHILLGVRSIYIPIEPGKPDAGMGTDAVNNQPQQQYSFAPGDTLRVNVAGFGDLTITGEWIDHVPVGEGQIDPEANQLRILRPVILRGDQVLGDIEGMSAVETSPSQVAAIYLAGQGRFIFSLSPIPGAVQADVNFNRITFTSDGQTYKLVAGAPIARSNRAWALYQPNFAPPGDLAGHSYIEEGEINDLLGADRQK
jgi:hypothetical protein